MALAELLQVLEQEAEARIVGLLAGAHADAERLTAEMAAARARESAEHVALIDARLRAEAALALDTARRGGAERVLRARAEALERLRRRATEVLMERAGDPAVTAAMQRDLINALEYVGPAAAVVEAPAAMLEALRRSVPDQERLTFMPSRGDRPGVTVRSADGQLTVDATLPTRLDRAWPRLSIKLAQRLETLP